jgi:hypothetical protein
VRDASAMALERLCPRCGLARAKAGSKRGCCPDCYREYQREWRAQHPDYMRKWKDAHPEAVAQHEKTSQAKRKVGEFREPRECPMCLGVFQPRATQKYCSRACAALARRGQNYGVGPGEFRRILQRQGGRCAICHGRAEKWHIDHDHLTGEVRDILCPTCNWGLGHFRDDPALLGEAQAYLERHHAKRQLRLVEDVD